MRMRVMLAALTAIALGAAACGEPGTVGASAEPAPTTAAPETTTTTSDPGPPRYNVSLDVVYLEDFSSVYHVGFPPELPDTTYGFEVTYHLDATIEEAEIVEPDAAGTLDWWIYDYDYVATELVDFWTGTEPADFDVSRDTAIFGRHSYDRDHPVAGYEELWESGATLRLKVRDDELWLLHSLPSAVEMADPPEDTGWDYWAAWGLAWGPGALASQLSYNGGPQKAYWVHGGWFDREGEGPPNYLNPTPERAGWVVWSMPLEDVGIGAHDIDFEMIEDDVQHVYRMHVTGTIAPASS